MTKKERALNCINILKTVYPNAICSLDAGDAFQLLVATRLSAQCTDARVNLVTPELFHRFPTAQDMAEATYEQIENIIKPCGLYKTKAKSLVDMARLLTQRYQGQVPSTLEELILLPGIGRKTANLIMGDIYKQPGSVVADTHLIRITNRIGLVSSVNPYQVELSLRNLLPPEESNDFCHRIVHFGREICTARSPKCPACPLADCCRKIGVLQPKNAHK